MNLSTRFTLGLCIATLACALMVAPSAVAQVAGQNVNMVSGSTWPGGDPFLERQNEASLAVSTRNPLHLLAGANDYRTVDLSLIESEPGEVNTCPPSTVSCPGTAEPWVGQYISIDGGARWQSTLLPGYRQDISIQGMQSPLHGFTTASDPVVRAGTNGLFYYAGIAFNRGTSNGVVFVARFMDLNNKENGNVANASFPIRYMNTVVVARGSNTQFLDKPWIAVDIPRSGRSCSLSIPQGTGNVVQAIPAGNVYIAYANITTTNGVVTSTIYFSRSTDCGNTWSAPIALSRGYALSQGTTIQIDPQTGIVYVAWRTFHSGTKQPNDAIAVAVSLDGGYNFTTGFPVVTLPAFNPSTLNAPAFFEQGTTGTSFRSAAYPAMAVADSGIPWLPGLVYFAWSQRGVGLNGAARIMMLAIPGNAMITPNGIILPTPFPVDNLPITDDSGQTFGRGHQWGPSMTFIEGKLMLVYYDQRLDHTVGSFQPVLDSSGTFFVADPQGRFYRESRELAGELASPTSKFDAVFTPYVDDANPPLDLRRHTIDVTLAQSDGGFGIPMFSYTRVSRYDFGLLFKEPDTKFHQLKLNPPGLPMFMKGTVPFMGDYIDIVGQMFVPKASGGWAFNNPGVNPSSPVHYAAWTSNQDVIPPIDGDWTKYFPITSGTSIYDGTSTPACRPGTGYEGDRNQNVYQSRITQGLLVSSPQNSKPLSMTIQRAFVVLVQNFTIFQKNFRLTIANQPPGSFAIAGQATAGGYASFQQALPNQPTLPKPLPALVKTQDVTIAGHSGAARTLFALSSSPTASIMVNVNEIDQNGNVLSGGLSGFILLNADGTVPTLTNPDSAPANTNITGVEVYTPGITGPGITGSNVNAMTITSPGITGPGITGSTCTPGITGPGITGPGITGTGCVAPGITGPGITGPGITGPGITGSTLVSPGITGPGITGPGITGSAVSDATYSVGSGANTNTGLTVKLTGCDISPCKDTPLQLIVSQIYATPNTDGQCNLISVQQDITLSNVPHPTFTPVSNPGITGSAASDAAFSLAPGDTALITLRGHTDIATMQTIVTQVAPVVVPQAIRTDSTATTPPVIAPLFITTSALPDAVVGTSYSTTLNAIGGTSPYQSWSLSEVGGNLPPRLNLTLDSETGRGLISGFPTSAGTFIFTVQVIDSANPTRNRATKQFSIRVALPLAVATASPLPTATQGSAPPAPITTTGGTGPYSWTPVTVDGMSLNSNGVFSGTPTLTGTFTFTAQVIDSASPSQTATKSMTLSVIPATPAPPTGLGTLLFDNFNAAGVSNGPQNPTTFVLNSTSEITQLATYHWYDGAGAPPGTIALQLQFPRGVVPIFGPFTAVGVSGQNNIANAAWVTSPNPNVIVPAGTYTVLDSSPATWSFNSGSNNSGFTRVWGFAVQVSHLAFVTPPSDTPVGQLISPSVQVKATDSSPVPAALPFIPITISIGSNPGGGTLSGTLTQTTDATGIATFSNLSIDKAGSGYTLLASSTSPATATSNAFNATACAPFPAGLVPFTTIFSIARDSAGDAFVVGGRPNGGIVAALQSVQLPSLLNERFCNPVTLETNYTVPAYVPTAAERQGDFSSYAGLALIDPMSNQPFPGNTFPSNNIPASRLDTIFAWRIPPHSSVLPLYNCSIEPTLKSVEGNVTTSVQFQNQTTGTGNVGVYWIDYAGQRVSYKTLGPGESYVQQTYLTHPWVVTDGANNANNCLGIWLPSESPDTAVITGSVTAPAPPTSLLAAPLPSAPSASVALTWTSSTSTVVGYNVYRARVSGGPYTKLTSVPVNATSFTDTTVSPSTTPYFYVVTAVSPSSVESPNSNEAPVSII